MSASGRRSLKHRAPKSEPLRSPSEGPSAPAGLESLAEAARRGDRDAFGRIWERCAPTLHGILLSMAPPEEARDMLQEVSLRALRSIERLADPARVGPWLCTIARNLGRDSLAKGRPWTPLPDDLVASRAPADSRATAVLAHIHRLPEAYREPLVLRLVEGLTGPEIAATTGLTQGSVRVNLCRGMKLLRESLDREELA